MAFLTGLVLAAAAGLNAYIPLLGLGLLARFTNFVNLPSGWEWLASDWMLILLGVLFVVEFLVDKVPFFDTINDVLQTVIRPASGGMVFLAGSGSETLAINNPQDFNDWGVIGPLIAGIVIALIPHIAKSLARPLLNTVSGGAAAPLISTAEDAGAISITLLAIVLPVLALLLMLLIAVLFYWRIKKARLKKSNRALNQ